MLAVYKKDIRAFFGSLFGFIVTGAFFIAAGVVFISQNLFKETSNLKPFFDTLSNLFIVLVPAITKNTVAQERKNGTDRLLITSPVSIKNIVNAKYLACMTILLICVSCSLLFLLLTAMFGELAIGEALVSLLGLLLLGSATVSIGILISAIAADENTAAIITFVVLGFLLVISLIVRSAPIGLSEPTVLLLSPYSFLEYYEAGILRFSSILYYFCLSFIALQFAGRSIERRRMR